MKIPAVLGITLSFVIVLASCQSPTPTAASTGEQLYSMHCSSCHLTEVHWRDQRLAHDWTTLRSQVQRWQENIGIGWSQDQVDAVAKYLNDLYYRFPRGE